MNQITKEINVGVSPLSHEEQIEATGGVPWILPVLVGALIGSAINNFGDIREGFSDGFSGAPPRH